MHIAEEEAELFPIISRFVPALRLLVALTKGRYAPRERLVFG